MQPLRHHYRSALLPREWVIRAYLSTWGLMTSAITVWIYTHLTPGQAGDRSDDERRWYERVTAGGPVTAPEGERSE